MFAIMTSQQRLGVPKTEANIAKPLSEPPYDPRPTYPLHIPTRPSPLSPSLQSRQASHHNSLQDTPSGQYPAAVSTTPFVPYHYYHYSPLDWQSGYLIPTHYPTLQPPPQSRQAGHYSYRPDIPSKNFPTADSIIPVAPRYGPFDSRSSRPLQAPTHGPVNSPPQNGENFYGSRGGPHTIPPSVEQGVLSGKKY
jgi:hypothetical protein